ncbi:MAG: nucleotide exchange factor GrpE, partial [Oscillospiraceae bacterium]|nr:nucleotide exchange factor GrpE [Oscillospiraceae bacterium]
MREEELKTGAAAGTEEPQQEAPEETAAPQEAEAPQEAGEEAAEGEKEEEKKSFFGKKADKQLEAAKAKLEAAEKEAEELKDRLLRTAAEYDNFRKRSAREQDAAFGNGMSYAVEQLLPIL